MVYTVKLVIDACRGLGLNELFACNSRINKGFYAVGKNNRLN